MKLIGCVPLNKYDAVMEKVVGNRGDPVIYVRNSKDFKITRKKKIQERSNPCTGNRYIL